MTPCATGFPSGTVSAQDTSWEHRQFSTADVTLSELHAGRSVARVIAEQLASLGAMRITARTEDWLSQEDIAAYACDMWEYVPTPAVLSELMCRTGMLADQVASLVWHVTLTEDPHSREQPPWYDPSDWHMTRAPGASGNGDHPDPTQIRAQMLMLPNCYDRMGRWYAPDLKSVAGQPADVQREEAMAQIHRMREFLAELGGRQDVQCSVHLRVYSVPTARYWSFDFNAIRPYAEDSICTWMSGRRPIRVVRDALLDYLLDGVMSELYDRCPSMDQAPCNGSSASAECTDAPAGDAQTDGSEEYV